MKKTKTAEEILFEKEGRGRFHLQATTTFFQLPNHTSTGPRKVGTNLPVPGRDNSPVLPRVKLVGRLQKDAMGNDVRVFVPFKRRRRK